MNRPWIIRVVLDIVPSIREGGSNVVKCVCVCVCDGKSLPECESVKGNEERVSERDIGRETEREKKREAALYETKALTSAWLSVSH